MLERLKRRRGGQPGNKNSLGHQNALKHGSTALASERGVWLNAGPKRQRSARGSRPGRRRGVRRTVPSMPVSSQSWIASGPSGR